MVPDLYYESEGNEDPDYEVTPTMLTKRLKHLSTVLDKFWRRWKSEYLLELRESHRYNSGNSTERSISVGDIVVVHNDDKPRGFWRLARVEDLITGRDGQVRGAVLRVHSKNNHSTTTLRRPIQRLYPLEVRATQKPPHAGNQENFPDPRSHRPTIGLQLPST